MSLIDKEKLLADLRELEEAANDRMEKRTQIAILTCIRLVEQQYQIEIPMKTTERGKHEAVL